MTAYQPCPSLVDYAAFLYWGTTKWPLEIIQVCLLLYSYIYVLDLQFFPLSSSSTFCTHTTSFSSFCYSIHSYSPLSLLSLCATIKLQFLPRYILTSNLSLFSTAINLSKNVKLKINYGTISWASSLRKIAAARKWQSSQHSQNCFLCLLFF